MGMAVSALLAVLKIVAGSRAGSAATVADGFESAADVAASGLLSLGLTLAAKPADEDHPYGHGRFEILTGLLIGLLLVATGVGITTASWMAMAGESTPPSSFAAWALVISLIAKGSMSYQKIRLAKRIRSSALAADGKNDLVDLISGGTALACLGLTLLDPVRFRHADSIGAVLVGLIVVFLGLQVILETSGQLVDTMPAGGQLQELRAAAMRVPGVAGIEKVHARKTGLRWHVDMHVHVDSNMSVRDSHMIAGKVKSALREELDWIENVLIHIEPANE
ncbi:MAG: cation transporter [Acidobacteria bacterium]|nr:cation transporter [Acidobacteriota bacterium]